MFSRISVFLSAPKWLAKSEPIGGSGWATGKHSSRLELVDQKGNVVTTRAISVVK